MIIADSSSADRTPQHRLRSWSAGILVVFVGILGPAAVVANWARNVVTDTDAYVAAVAPLATDPAVSAALQERLVGAVMETVEGLGISEKVQQYLNSRDVPDPVADAVTVAIGSLSDNIRNLASSVVQDVIGSAGFAEVWERVNRAAHQQFVQVMDEQGALVDQSGNLALQLEPLLVQVRERLVTQGYSWGSRIPESTASYVLVSADDLAAARGYYAQLVRWAIATTIVALVALIGAVVLARSLRRGIVHAFTALACGSTVLALLFRWGENAVSQRAASPDAAHAILTTSTAGLTGWIRFVALISLLVAVLAAVWKPGQQLTRIGAALLKFRAWWLSPANPTIRRVVSGLVAFVGLAVLLYSERLPTGVVLGLAALVLVALLLAVIPTRETPVQLETHR